MVNIMALQQNCSKIYAALQVIPRAVIKALIKKSRGNTAEKRPAAEMAFSGELSKLPCRDFFMDTIILHGRPETAF